MNSKLRIRRIEREMKRREIASRPPRLILYQMVYADGSPAGEFIAPEPTCNRVAGKMKSWKR